MMLMVEKGKGKEKETLGSRYAEEREAMSTDYMRASDARGGVRQVLEIDPVCRLVARR